MALNQPSVSLAYETTLFSGNSLSTHNDVQAETIRNRDEMVFIPSLQIMPGYSDNDNVLTDHQFVKQPLNPHYHGLSLSLGSQVPPLVQGPSSFNQLSLHTIHNESKNVQYQLFDLAGSTRVNNEAMGITGSLWNSKYLIAAQDLLDEVVSVHRALEKPEKRQEFGSLGRDGSTGMDMKGDELAIIASCELSQSERQDLQNKLTKLLTMLDEVDTRYKNYQNQMQVVVSSFEMVAGRGAARPYTTLARRTISRQFRCLHDAIKREIRVTQKALGEQDVTSHGQGVLSRLRFVDQQLRQQKALQQFGITGQPWRPQRGLPENAVSILRSWLFEHFLHPYPKDSEKIILAKQTGLTRSQVANWFINARVRLWKPMIEEMYKEEFGDSEEQPKTSPEHGTFGQEKSPFDDRDEELQGSLMLASSEFRPDVSSSSQWDVQEAKLAYHGATYQEKQLNFGRNELYNDVSMSGNAIGNQVSLALGLQNSEKNPQSVYVDPVNQQHRFANPHLLSDFVA